MEKIVFDSDQDNLTERLLRDKGPKGLPGLVIKLSRGIIQTESMANLVLLALAVFFFGLSFFILFNTFN